MATIYPAQANSPQTLLSAQLSADAVTVPVQSAAVLPAAPNLAVIGTGEDCETILYTGKSGNNLTGVTRGFEGTAKAWPAQTVIARNFTAWDFNNMAAVKADKEETETALADKVDTVDALPVYAMARSSDPTDCWQPTPGIAVPDTGPYTGMAIRAVWEEEWDASVPIWAFGGTEPVKPEGTYPAGAYILMWDGEAFQLQADMASVVPKADSSDALTVIPTVTLLCDTAGDLSYDLRRDGTVYWLNGATGEAIRVVSDTAWQASGTAPKYGINIRGGTKPIKPAGTYPAGAYILMYDGGAFQVQADMAYTDERAEQAADEAAEAHAAQVRRTYQPAWKRTAGGCPVSVADAAEETDLSSLVLKGRTVVSGTPSPDAPVTITGVKPQTVAVTGKNLIPPKAASETTNGVTCTVNNDGSLTLNGTATATTFFNFPYIKIIPGFYTLSAGVKLADNVNLILRKRTPEKQLIYVYSGSVSNAKTELIGYSGEVRVYVEVRSGTTVSNLTIYPQLEVGSEPTAYEPYCGETITSDEAELYGDAHVVGKNLIPTLDEPLAINGITCQVNVDGSITLNGTATASSSIHFSNSFYTIALSPGSYALSTGATLPSGISLILRKSDAADTLMGVYQDNASTVKNLSYKGSAFVYLYIQQGTTVSNLTIYPQLEAGSEATAYEPYQGMTTALEDGDSLDLATGEVVRRWKRLELDGTEKWTIRSANEHGLTNFSLIMIDPYLTKFPNAYCTHYPTQNTLFADTTDRGILLSANYTIYIRETYTTVEDFKAYLAAQKEAGTPVTVLYKLKEPEVVSGEAHSLAQPEGEMMISALGTRGETAEAVDTEALYTYRPDWDDVLNRLAESEVQQAEMQTVLEQVQAKLAELTATE